jgi:cytosine/adenosine deaminase-related metal-dependent hydrolase
MRTLLKAAWVIGFDGRSHVVWRDAQVVFSGSRIEFVGRDFAGHVDRTVDYGQAVIGPGFIDLDALGDIDTGILTVDNGDKRENGRLWSEDYLREGPVDAFDQEEEVFKVRYAFAHLIRNGVTTALPISSMYYRAWAERYDEFVGIAAVAGELGLRVYLGPCCMTGITVVRTDRSLDQHWDEARGLFQLDDAIRYVGAFDGAHGGLVRGMFAPDRIETCTPALLERLSAANHELRMPVRLHACQSLYEFDTVLRLRGSTPLGWLERVGLLNERLILPHGIYLSGNSGVARTGDEDWQRLVGSGASIAHCPAVFARTGEALNSFQKYQAAGINLGMGTDTWPADLLHNLQVGLYAARVVGHSATQPAMADLYTAATLGGARALGRDDLGRLAPGAQADIAVFDLRGTHLGPVFDPVKNLILAGRGTDCRASYIAGRCVMEDFQVHGIDMAALQRQAESQFAKLLEHQRRRRFVADRGKPAIQSVFPQVE